MGLEKAERPPGEPMVDIFFTFSQGFVFSLVLVREGERVGSDACVDCRGVLNFFGGSGMKGLVLGGGGDDGVLGSSFVR